MKERMIFLDVGCILGFYSFPAASIVGEEGLVYALDIKSDFTDYISHKAKKNERIFGKSTKQNKTWLFKLQRTRLARKLGNERFLRIPFHTLRHWKGTMEYYKTKEPWHVKKVLGLFHHPIENYIFVLDN